MYGRGVLFVPGARWGGIRKASTVWRQVATARGPQPWRLDRRLAPVAAQTAIDYEYRFTEYRFSVSLRRFAISLLTAAPVLAIVRRRSFVPTKQVNTFDH
jgi:hypothetical protein